MSTLEGSFTYKHGQYTWDVLWDIAVRYSPTLHVGYAWRYRDSGTLHMTGPDDPRIPKEIKDRVADLVAKFGAWKSGRLDDFRIDDSYYEKR